MSSIKAAALLKNPVHGVVLLQKAISDCNDRFCRIIGRGRADVIGKPLLQLCPRFQSDGAFSSERWQRRWQAARFGLPQWFPWQFRTTDGRRVHALLHLTADGALEGELVAYVHDLSNLREAGWIKPESYGRLQAVLDDTKAIIFVKDRDGRYIFANRELERLVRVPAERIVGRTDHELWPAAVAAEFRANDAQVLLHKSGFESEVTGEVRKRRRSFLSFKVPLFDAEGEPYAVCGIATDITERKRTQDALTSAALAVSSAGGATVFQELVRYLATILGADAATITAPHEEQGPRKMRVQAFFLDGQIADNFDYPLAGTPCETVIGQQFRFYPSRLRETFPADAAFVKLGLESYAGFPLQDGNGASLGVIAVASRRPLGTVEFTESILKIFAVRAAAELERQRAEETLRWSEASYRALFEASEDAVFIHDWDTGAVIDVNRRACEIYGYAYEEMKRVGMVDLSAGEHPYTREEAAKRLQEAKAGKTVRLEWLRRNRDGTLHWDEVVLRPAVIAGLRRILAFTREITERKQAEQALRQAQKMQALGQLTGGIAHDFNNLLTTIMGYVVLAADRPSAAADTKLESYLAKARRSCESAHDVIQQMLAFSRGRRGQPRPVALQRVIAEAVKLFGPSLPVGVEVETRFEEEIPAVMLDPVHLEQILLNLCLNARDAMNGAGTIRVSAGVAPAGEYLCTACRERAVGAFVEVCVEDSGCGIAPDIVDRIFEPFFTTKAVGKGSGMGLASVHGIVHELGGHIIVDTAPGKGTRFRILFPAHHLTDDQPMEPNTRTAAPLRNLHGHVLVVDDQHAVAAYMSDLLESWGLEATTAESGSEALSLVLGGKRRFDVVITDHVMPGITGLELARELRSRCPDLPVILYTAFKENIAQAELDDVGLCAVLSKPVNPHELFGMLQSHVRFVCSGDTVR